MGYQLKHCKKCNFNFQPNSGAQIYCERCRQYICEYCKEPFIILDGQYRRRFCSNSCRALGQPEKIKNLIAHKGKKPRTWHKTHRNKHGNAFDREWRTKIFNRDNYTCKCCGKKGGRLQAHHIKGYKKYPKLRYELNNGITLCIKCHQKTDNYGYRSAKRRIATEANQLKLFKENA